jgi:hypothetical protein
MTSPLRPIGNRVDSFGLIAAAGGVVFGVLARVVQVVTTLDGALAAGAFFGIISGLLSYAKWRQVAWDAPKGDWTFNRSRLTQILTELSYETVSTTGDAITFDKLGVSKVSLASVASLSPGTLYRVTAVVVGDDVTITGPQEVLKILQRRLGL